MFSKPTQQQRSTRDQVWDAVDPKGGIRALLQAAEVAPRAPVWVRTISADLAAAWDQLGQFNAEQRRLVRDIAQAVDVLVPRGWSVMLMQSDALREAIQLVQAGRGDKADERLADQWEGEGNWRTKRVVDRVRVMGAGDPAFHELFERRAALLWKAKEHHDAGRYDASIPILLMHMEGIAIDVSPGKKFFTKGNQKADLVDPLQLVSIEAGLAALQALYGADVPVTQAQGALSRHGVLHGRELAYDTRINSAKTWSVMDALVEWALPAARAETQRRKRERQQANAGSQDVDETGRRVDDREFSETRTMLVLLGAAAMGWHGQRGSFRDDLVGTAYASEDFVRRGLPAAHGTHQQVSEDGQDVMYWRATPSGWVLGAAVTAEGGLFHDHFYAGPVPPSAGPTAAPDEWSRERRSDWQSR